MPDFSVKQLMTIVESNPDIPWADFECTPILAAGEDGKKLSRTAKRCAITAGGITVVARLPHESSVGSGTAWRPQPILDAIMEIIGPTVPV